MTRGIRVKNTDDIQKINKIVTRYGFDIWIHGKSGMVDAKSLLGMFLLSLNEAQGAVCEPVARRMAEGARSLLGADYALSVTGNAGPGTDEKNPRVGEIFVACADAAGTRCVRLECGGTRGENREAACRAALRLLLERAV